MESRVVRSLALALYAAIAGASALPDATKELLRRQDPGPEDAIAQIIWFSGPDCDVTQSENYVFYNVPYMAATGINFDSCNRGDPLYSDSGSGETATLFFKPASFYVSSTPNTCNPDFEGGQELPSFSLYPSCTPKLKDPFDDATYVCDCDSVGWGLAEQGYQQCVNIPEYANGDGPTAHDLEQRIRFC